METSFIDYRHCYQHRKLPAAVTIPPYRKKAIEIARGIEGIN